MYNASLPLKYQQEKYIIFTSRFVQQNMSRISTFTNLYLQLDDISIFISQAQIPNYYGWGKATHTRSLQLITKEGNRTLPIQFNFYLSNKNNQYGSTADDELISKINFTLKPELIY